MAGFARFALWLFTFLYEYLTALRVLSRRAYSIAVLSLTLGRYFLSSTKHILLVICSIHGFRYKLGKMPGPVLE